MYARMYASSSSTATPPRPPVSATSRSIPETPGKVRTTQECGQKDKFWILHNFKVACPERVGALINV